MKRGSRGQSLVETTLILAAFLALLLGMAGVGQMLFSRQTLAQRVHDAARWGALNRYDPQAIRNVVLYGAAQPTERGQPFLGLAPGAVAVDNPGCPGAECRVVVAIPEDSVRSVEPMECGAATCGGPARP